jgi:hypothetical protein
VAKVWLSGAGIDVTDEAVLLELKTGPWGDVVEGLLRRKAAAARAVEEGIAVPEDEVDEALAEFYADRGLLEDAQAAAWRQERHVAEEDLRGLAREQCLVRRLRERLAPDEVVERRFRANPLSYARVEVEVFKRPTEGAARELMLAVREGEITPGAGERRRLAPASAPEEIAAQLFGAREGDMLGPVEADDGGYDVYRVTARAASRLDQALRDAIRDEILEEALAPAFSRNPVSFRA